MRPDVLAASLAINVLGLALPIAILQVYDRVIRHHALSTLTVLTIAVLAAFALEFVAARLARAHHVGRRRALRPPRELQRAATPAGDRHRRDSATTRLAPKPSASRRSSPSAPSIAKRARLLADLPFVILFVAMIGVIAGWMALLPIVCSRASSALGLNLARRMTVETGRREQRDVRRHNFLIECISGITTIKALGMEALMQRRHERLQEDSADAFGAIAHATTQTQSIAAELAQAASVLTVAIGAIAVVEGQLTIGGLAATTILTGRFLQPVLKGLGLWARYPFIRLAEEKVRRLHDLTPQIAGQRPLPKKPATLKLDGVSFHYEGAPFNAVNGVTLEIPPNAYIGITGPTSSGRTTLLKLVNGLLNPSQGSIRYDDIPLRLYATQDLRRQIALMPTSPTIYAGTLLENLTLFEDGPAKRRALALCRVLGLEDYIASLSRGLDTPLTGTVRHAARHGAAHCDRPRPGERPARRPVRHRERRPRPRRRPYAAVVFRPSKGQARRRVRHRSSVLSAPVRRCLRHGGRQADAPLAQTHDAPALTVGRAS